MTEASFYASKITSVLILVHPIPSLVLFRGLDFIKVFKMQLHKSFNLSVVVLGELSEQLFHQRGDNGQATLFVRNGADAFLFQGVVTDDDVVHNLLIAVEIVKCLVSFGTVDRGEKTC